MPSYTYGGKRGRSYDLELSEDFVAIRTQERDSLDTQFLSRSAFEATQDLEKVFELPGIGVEVHRVRPGREPRAARERATAMLGAEPNVDSAGRVLCDAAGIPVLYTENLFVKFKPDLAESACRRTLESRGVAVKRPIEYLRNAYFACVPAGSGLAVFDAAEALLDEENVELCHPELVRQGRTRGLFPEQWHLAKTTLDGREIDAHVDAEKAWAITHGEGVTIAVIDDAFDIDHEELASPGKIVAPRDATLKSADPRGDGEPHGTACAGVACAEGLHRACGVAPRARLLPIRLRSGLGSQDEADAFHWAAQNGADVISCSWGPEDGDWRLDDDPRHKVVHPLPDSTRLAIDWTTEHGRGGKGCVIAWAAGNGGQLETVDNDGYASYERVMAVAACNVDAKQCVYSEPGAALWCSFPSRDFETAILQFGIWTTDRTALAGYNPGNVRKGDRKGNYIKSFHGTSSACPGVAGVSALVLAANPGLDWRQVREIVRETCDRIDLDGGDYDANGHSRKYGFGRVNAARAVEKARATEAAALPAAPAPAAPETPASTSMFLGATARAAEPPRSRPRATAPAPPPLAISKMAEVVVQLESEGAEGWLKIDDRPLHLRDGVARMHLALGEPYILTWWLSGPQGSSYRIAIDADDHVVDGSLPIESNIPQDGTKSAGTRKFTIENPQ